jgi:hypothetical protein
MFRASPGHWSEGREICQSLSVWKRQKIRGRKAVVEMFDPSRTLWILQEFVCFASVGNRDASRLWFRDSTTNQEDDLRYLPLDPTDQKGRTF